MDYSATVSDEKLADRADFVPVAHATAVTGAQGDAAPAVGLVPASHVMVV